MKLCSVLSKSESVKFSLIELVICLFTDFQKLNKSMCEELFGGELDVTEEPGEDMPEKSQARQHRDWLHQLNEKDWYSLQKVMDTLKEMEKFCKTKKNMFLPIREGLTEALREMQVLKERMKRYAR